MRILNSFITYAIFLILAVIAFPRSMAAQTGAVRERVTERVDMQKLVTLRGNVHPLARPEFDQGVAPDDLPLNRILLVLQRGADQEAALRQLLDNQQVKSSPQFHQWLTPEQFGQQYGPADSDLQAVTDWLAGQGFQVSKVSAGRTVIEFSGTAGLVRQALGTEIHKFALNNQTYWANSSDPQIPAALAPVVAGFASLNNFPRKPMSESLGTFRRSKATGVVQPLFTFPISCGTGISTCYYLAVGPTDFATIYNVLPLWNASTPTDGTGQTIAVAGETNINIQDVRDFRSMFALPAHDPNIILNGPNPGINGEEREADLDVQWSGAVAKGATIDLVVSETTEATAGIDLSAVYIIDNNLAPVMSESYGGCEAQMGAGGNQFHSTLWEQAAAQGITVLISAGDSGAAGCDSVNAGETAAQYGLAVNGLASTPFNVAVGGTDFNVNPSNAWTYWSQGDNQPSMSSALSYIPESSWNDSCADSGLLGCTPPPSTIDLSDGFYLLAGSGGPSSCTNPTGTFPSVTCSGNYPKPSWQSGTGVPNDGARDVPDLSLFAGDGVHYSFYVVCQMDVNQGSSTSCDLNAPYYDFQAASGTSASVQAFAGIMALVNQRYGRQGNANYVLYPMAAKSGASCNSSTAPVTNSSCIFYDVTVGNNSVICPGGSPNCSNTTSGEYGVMVSGGSPAYPTTAGYDLATGLGSVNVANLVNNWTSSFTPSTTTLSLSTTPATNPITLTHGQPIDFTINVGPGSGSGTATGDVSLIAQTGSSSSNVTGIGPFTLSGGAVSNSTDMLPGGSYTVTAHYAGNGTFAASDSAPGIPVTVGKESSQTEVRLVALSPTVPPVYNLTSVPYGSPYFLRMDVTNSSGQLCANPSTGSISYSCPTGSLSVSPAPTEEKPPAGTVAGSYTLNSQGYAEDQPIQQSAGKYNFVAQYSGDISYTPNTSAPVPITITQAPTTTTITGLASSVVVGTVSFTVDVTTQSSGVGPTGSIQIKNGNTNLTYGGDFGSDSNSPYASLAAALVVNLPPGPATLTALYSGDSNYEASTSAPVTFNVTDFGVSVNPTSITIPAPGQSATATLNVASLYGFAGTVNLTVPPGGCITGATCTVSPASVTVTGTTPGQSTLTITTTVPSSAAPLSVQRRVPPGFRAPAGWRWLLAALLALVTLLSLTTTRGRPAAWPFATALLLVGVWVACGGGGGGNGGGTIPSGPAPLASLTPTAIAFNSQVVNSASVGLTAQLFNSGNATMAVSGIAISGANTSDFAQTNNCGSTLAIGAFCTIVVTFTPTTMGSRSALLMVTDNSSGSPQSVTLTGTGTQPMINISPAALSFGRQAQNTQSASQTITLSNTSGSPVTFSYFATDGANAGQFGIGTNTCGMGLAAGATCTVNLYFWPTLTGTFSAVFLVEFNGSSIEQTVSLSGTGVTPSTPPGNYTISVEGSSDGDNHFLSIPLTVQ